LNHPRKTRFKSIGSRMKLEVDDIRGCAAAWRGGNDIR
jgi:hypothetical protein